MSRGCACDAEQSRVAEARANAAFAAEAEKQPRRSEPEFFVLKDIQSAQAQPVAGVAARPRRRRRRIPSPALTPADAHPNCGPKAVETAKLEKFGDQLGRSRYNGPIRSRTQCHLHVHVGKLFHYGSRRKRSKFKLVRPASRTSPAPADGDGRVDPRGSRRLTPRSLAASQTMETVLGALTPRRKWSYRDMSLVDISASTQPRQRRHPPPPRRQCRRGARRACRRPGRPTSAAWSSITVLERRARRAQNCPRAASEPGSRPFCRYGQTDRAHAGSRHRTRQPACTLHNVVL